MNYNYWSKEEIESFLKDFPTCEKDELITKYRRKWKTLQVFAKKYKCERLKKREKKTRLSLSKRQICDLYIKGDNIKSLTEKSKGSKSWIVKCLKQDNIEIREKDQRSVKKYTLNDDYFEKINTDKKAYFLGFILADGCIRKNSIDIRIVEKHKYILEEFKKELQCNKPIKFIKYDNINHQNQVGLYIGSKKLVEDLSKLGIIKNKSYDLDNFYIPEGDLFYSFLRGIFDGDGCIHLFCKNQNNIKATFSIVGTNSFCIKIKSEIEKRFDKINIRISARYKERPLTGNSLSFTSNYSIFKLLKKMYTNSKGLFIKDKFYKFITLKKHILKNKKLLKRLL